MSNKKIDLVSKMDGIKVVKTVVLEDKGLTYTVLNLSGLIGVGYAKCSPKDKFNAETGIEIATRRACKHIAIQMEELGKGVSL